MQCEVCDIGKRDKNINVVATAFYIRPGNGDVITHLPGNNARSSDELLLSNPCMVIECM